MRFVFSVPSANVYGVIHAVSKLDAQHQLMNGRYAHLYGRVQWLSTEEEQPSCGRLQAVQEAKAG